MLSQINRIPTFTVLWHYIFLWENFIEATKLFGTEENLNQVKSKHTLQVKKEIEKKKIQEAAQRHQSNQMMQLWSKSQLVKTKKDKQLPKEFDQA